MKHVNIITMGMFVSLLGTAHAGIIDFTTIGYVQYGDAQSYSLPIAELQNSDYSVSSTPGQIKDFIVVATGSSGQPVNTNFAGMDDAYSTPSGESDPGSNFFSTGTYTDPGADDDFFGDKANTWDSSLSALMSFLDGDDMVFMFNNNNFNSGNEQSLAAWMQITLTDDSDKWIATYDLTNLTTNDPNDEPKYDLVTAGGGGVFNGDVTSYTSDKSGPKVYDNGGTDYVLSGGPICVNTDGPVPIPLPCDNPGVTDGPINHNLGADEVAYAVIFPELNAQLTALFENVLDLDDYTMHLDLRTGCDPTLFSADKDHELCTGAISGFGKNLNNGYEQLFIATTASDFQEVPEPKSFWLLVFGLTLLGIQQRSRRFRKVNLR